MFGIGKGSSTTTQAAAPNWGAGATTPAASGADPWGNMRQTQKPNMFQEMKYAAQQNQDRINNFSPEKKDRLKAFNQMAMSEPAQAQFSPVQFGGSGDGNQLAQFIIQLRNRLNQEG